MPGEQRQVRIIVADEPTAIVIEQPALDRCRVCVTAPVETDEPPGRCQQLGYRAQQSVGVLVVEMVNQSEGENHVEPLELPSIQLRCVPDDERRSRSISTVRVGYIQGIEINAGVAAVLSEQRQSIAGTAARSSTQTALRSSNSRRHLLD